MVQKKTSTATSKAAAKAKPAKSGESGGKAKKKKWSKGKSRDKLNNLVLFDKATYDKFLKEVPTYKLITPSVVSERLKVRGSLARAGLRELVAKNLIKVISRNKSQEIYTKIQKDEPETETPAKQ